MGGLTKSLGGLFSTLVPTPGIGLPPLPGDLGLPPLPDKVGQGFNQGKNPKDEDPKVIAKQIADANTYNKAFADLLNQQPHLTGSERSQLYSAYSVGAKDTHKGAKPTDFSGQLSQLNPDQFRAQQQQAVPQEPAPAPAPQAPVPQAAAAGQSPAVQAPQATGPAAQTVGPVPTPAVATESGNIAGKTTTTGGTESSTPGSSRKQRGRVATLLTGLGGALERFGS